MGWTMPPWQNTALRVFFLLLLPFFLGFYALPHSQAATGQFVPSFSGNRSSLAGALSFNYTHAQEAQTQFAQIASVFPLANYLNFYPLVSHKVTAVCFQDAGSRIELANGTVIYPDFYWEVSKPSFPPVIVQANSTACANTWEVTAPWSIRCDRLSGSFSLLRSAACWWSAQLSALQVPATVIGTLKIGRMRTPSFPSPFSPASGAVRA